MNGISVCELSNIDGDTFRPNGKQQAQPKLNFVKFDDERDGEETDAYTRIMPRKSFRSLLLSQVASERDEA